MQTRSLINKAAAAVFALAASSGAFASACAGPSSFTDIPQSAIYCTDAEWLANRGVTLGCGDTSFCPNDVVTRGSMALFMQRLGSALSSTILVVDTVPGPIDLDAAAPIIACQTADFAVSGFPRIARITTTFAGNAGAALNYQHEVYVSTNGGTTWTFTNGNINRSGTGGAQWISSNTEYIAQLAVGTTYRWGVRLGRESGTGDFTASRCFINVEVNSRTGTSSPFDSMIVSPVSDH